MFRGTIASKMQLNQFGVGSIVKAGINHAWLVVGQDNAVNLVDMHTMQLISHEWVNVEDMNFISTNEARELMCLTAYVHWTFTDFEFDAKGIKKIV